MFYVSLHVTKRENLSNIKVCIVVSVRYFNNNVIASPFLLYREQALQFQ